ncbi:helix-turn-helix transcriptional regulator [Cedecea sp.]|jgi:putative transcriptional regulator|uniref:helix-turn-helix domain-containing protein n=1 Tax=Cedecea sp. TaxID=1970739 RepID=UPI002F3E899E
MSIIIKLDIILKSKKMTAKELAQAIGITEANLSILNSGKAKAIRFSTLEAICSVLNCQPGDIIKYDPD